MGDDDDGWDGNLDALDAQLRSEAGVTQQQQEKAAVPAAADFDDGFSALDDLLGVDDSSSASPRAPRSSRSSDVDIDPFAKLDSPVITDSLDDLLSELPPPAARGAPAGGNQVATGRRPAAAAAAARTSTPPAPSPSSASGAAVSESWLDELLDLDNEDLKVSSSSSSTAAAGKATAAAAAAGPSSASGILESLVDDVTGGGGGGDAPPSAAEVPDRPVTVTGDAAPTPPSNPADTPAALDDWLNDLLEEDNKERAKSKPAAAAASASFQQEQQRRASLEDDPWDFAAKEGDTSGSGSFGDVITGSNQLEGWKANTVSSADAPRRSNVMGRRARGTGSSSNSSGGDGGAAAEGVSRPWDPESRSEEAEGGRSSDWGAGDAWTSKGDSGVSWWDKDGPGMGMEEATGRRGQGNRELDPVEEAQRACAADLKKLGQRGQWEDATRALVGARVRGVPVNVYMYNRCDRLRMSQPLGVVDCSCSCSPYR